MKNKSIILIIFLLTTITCLLSFGGKQVVCAEGLSDNIDEQLENIDLSELEEYYNSLNFLDNKNFFTTFNSLISGDFAFEGEGIINYLKNVLFDNLIEMLPSFISVIAISLFFGIMNSMRSSILSEGTTETVFFVCLLSIILIIFSEFVLVYNNLKITIQSLSKLSEIMSPILLTLMIACGGKVSATVYKPAVVFLSNGVINIMLYTVIPIVGILTILSVMSNFSSSIKLNKFVDFFSSIIKWIIGLIITIFGLFISIQGITSASFDGISIKAAKYAIANSVPIVGGFLKDGFDLVVAGSIIIKNSVGLITVICLFYTILSPLMHMIALNFALKLVSAVIEPIADVRICNLCTSISKSIVYLIAILISVGLMLFITVLLMIISANSFFI